MQQTTSHRHLTPPKIAARLGVAPETVIGWIRDGELIASNVAKRSCRRPRYRVDPADLEAFLASRRPNSPATTKAARRKQERGVIAFY
jgi:hypothetical protein